MVNTLINKNNAENQIEECLTLIKSVLGNDLLGIYVYGSSLLGGLQVFSDLDLFVISRRPTTISEKREIANSLLRISGVYMVTEDRYPIELTIVVQSDINPWKYPPQFDFEYGDWMRKDFEAGIIEPWPNKLKPVLSLVITQLLLEYRIIFGPTPEKLLDRVPYKDFILSTTSEIDSLMADIIVDTRNVLLTFARIWSTVLTDEISSKPAAATWAIEKLPNIYKPVMIRARSICLGEEKEQWNDMVDILKPSAEYMVEQIKKQMSKIESQGFSGRQITISK